MTPETTVRLVDVLSEVFEKQAFMFGEPCEKADLPDGGGAFWQVGIAFDGPNRGCLGLAAPAQFGAELAANVLGLETDDPQARTDAPDALKELLNVTCGQFLTEVYGTRPVFQLSIPEARCVDREAWDALVERPDTLGMEVDGMPVVAYFSTEAETR